MAAALAGLAYVGIVFAAGFVLGTVRVLVLAPHLGEALAVALELPAMLTLSWLACRWLTARLAVPVAGTARVVMGAIAFGVLMLAEIVVSIFGFGRSIGAHLAHYREVPALMGLFAQIAFAVFPWLQVRLDRGA